MLTHYLDRFTPDYELDKDMFGDGTLYSPETCTLLPRKVNGFLSDNYSSTLSGLPDGVNIVKPKTIGASVGYIVRCSVNGVREYLGFYSTPEEAYEVYKEAKEGEARRLADEYKDMLYEDQYKKLSNFTMKDIHRVKDKW